MTAITARQTVDLVALHDVDDRYWAKLNGLVNPEFRVDCYRPEAGDVALRIFVSCEVPACRGKALRDQRLCRIHHAQWAKADSPPLDAWLATFQTTEPVPQRQGRRCRVAGCPNSARGDLCRPHRNASLVAARDGVGLGEFLATAEPADPEPPCLVPNCGRARVSGRHPFCGPHYDHWAEAGRPAPESFITQARHVRTTGELVYSFHGLPPGPKLELQYCLQKRRDDAKFQMAPKRLTLLATAITTVEPPCGSILDHPLDFWEDALARVWASSPSKQLRKVTLSWLRWCYDQLQLLVEADPYAPDVWDLRRLPGATGGRSRTVRWDRITQPWLREAAKRWGRMRLVRVTSQVVSNDARQLGRFSAYLDALGVTGPAGITRDVIEAFIAELPDLAPSYPTRSRILGVVRTFLDDARHQDLLALHPTAVVLDGDWPRRDADLPRPIPEDAMAVLAAPEAIALLPDNGIRALIVVLMRTGRRASEALRLPFDPVVIGPDGDPYLRYNDWKTAKEAVIPLDPETTTAIRHQQAAVLDRFPNGCGWLFPAFRSNRAGRHHISYEALNGALRRWAANWVLYDLADPRTGQRPQLRLTAHRFRHTIATRMLNEDVPEWVVQRFLGHESPEMTARYAALHDKTLREHFDRFQHRVTAAGQVVQLIAEEPISEGMALAERLRRARQTLPNGYCARPVQTDCIHPNFCHGCTQFATDVTFLPVLRGQHQRATAVLELAQGEGRARWVERNQRDLAQLDTIITALQDLPEADEFPT